FHTLLGANVADDGFATVDANANVQCGLTTMLAHRVEIGGSTLHIQGHLHGSLWMIRLHEGCPKEGEDTITEEFVECALILEEDLDHHVKIGVQDIDNLLGGMLLSKGREVGASVLGGTPCFLKYLPRGPDDASWAWATHQSVTTHSRTDRETTA